MSQVKVDLEQVQELEPEAQLARVQELLDQFKVLGQLEVWGLWVEALEGQIKSREETAGPFTPIATLDDAFEHNTRSGEYLGLTLAFNMIKLLKEELVDIKESLNIYFENVNDDNDGGI